MISLGQARKIARAFAEVTEEDHFGRPSFRIGRRIFATVPDQGHLNVMIDPFDVEGVVRANPDACSELWWGKEVRGVKVGLKAASPQLLGDLLEAAWRRRAPRRLLAASGQPERRGRNGDRKGPTKR